MVYLRLCVKFHQAKYANVIGSMSVHLSVCYKYCTTSPTSEDILDTFTQNLVKHKRLKWESSKFCTRTRLCPKITSVGENHAGITTSGDVCQFSDDESLTVLLEKCLESEQYDKMVIALQDCHEINAKPSVTLLLNVASVFARTGRKNGIEAVQLICKKHYEKEYRNQAGFMHYIAESCWINGNISEALDIFMKVYRVHPLLQRKVRFMLKFLIGYVISEKGDAALVIVMKCAKDLAVYGGDYSVMAFVWQYCFVSEWFCDQQLALELLKEYSGLRNAVKYKISEIASRALKEHKVEIVYRLLEVLLLFDMRLQYSEVLKYLFNYKYLHGDLQACSAIIRSSVDLNIPLTASQHQQFLNLLLKHQRNQFFARYKPVRRRASKHSVAPFQMKF